MGGRAVYDVRGQVSQVWQPQTHDGDITSCPEADTGHQPADPLGAANLTGYPNGAGLRVCVTSYTHDGAGRQTSATRPGAAGQPWTRWT